MILTALGNTTEYKVCSYDWDCDGDGLFEITADSSGSQPADTDNAGIIRPAVRASSGGTPERAAMGSVSLLITGNSRPSASAFATPQSAKTMQISVAGFISSGFWGGGEGAAPRRSAVMALASAAGRFRGRAVRVCVACGARVCG